MERLVFLPRDTLCGVGKTTFGGAPQARILVPAEDYPMYRDGQGCQSNPWEPYLDRLVTY